MGLNETMNKLRVEHSAQPQPKGDADCPHRVPPMRDEPLTLPDQQPTIRDLSTALYKLKQQPTCRNCIRRERGNCPSKAPMPKSCVSFQLNSKQMQTYGQQARNIITAWREAIAIHAAREHYRQLKQIQNDKSL